MQVKTPEAAAYGGPRWSPRSTTHTDELGSIWAACGVGSEWGRLRTVLLHRPAAELGTVRDADAALMLDIPSIDIAARQHDALADAYREHDIDVVYVEPAAVPPPNLMYVADLLFMTPAGAIIGRPASTVRAGEERWIARRLADIGVPILRTIAGAGVFEGADAMWLDAHTVVVGTGLRTNDAGAAQVRATLAELGVRTIIVDVPFDAMHLMAQLRIIDRDLAFVRPGIAPSLLAALAERGYEVHTFPDAQERDVGFAYNFVTVAPRRILMPAGNPRSEAAYRDAGIACIPVDVSELTKAAGAVGCLTGILYRDPV